MTRAYPRAAGVVVLIDALGGGVTGVRLVEPANVAGREQQAGDVGLEQVVHLRLGRSE